MRWAEHVACREDRRSAYRVLVGRPDGKRALGWGDDNKMDLQEVGWGSMG
jgi:hypothetical protein